VPGVRPLQRRGRPWVSVASPTAAGSSGSIPTTTFGAQLHAQLQPVAAPTTPCPDCGSRVVGRTLEHRSGCPISEGVDKITDDDRVSARTSKHVGVVWCPRSLPRNRHQRRTAPPITGPHRTQRPARACARDAPPTIGLRGTSCQGWCSCWYRCRCRRRCWGGGGRGRGHRAWGHC